MGTDGVGGGTMVMKGFLRWCRGRRVYEDRPAGRFGTDREPAIGHDLPGKLELLVRRSWGPRQLRPTANFVLDIRHVPSGGLETFVAALLKHARFVAPRLNVPFMTPRIEIAEIDGACGLFVEDNGWVRFVLKTETAANAAVARAVLCHEVCHYILAANGIRLPDRLDNERLTDVAMFVFGMGGIFLDGFQTKRTTFNPRAYRVGYLTVQDYHFLSREAVRLRASGELQFGIEDELRGKLLNRLGGNKAALDRYLAHARARFPAKAESERIQGLLDDFDRGR